ncbi:hypothetical protein TELCIR_00040 [Teladorsagia circumcincta]|uniref:Uncharacterized protein n=1 Tax=Teladorsagia circumcincta TaxID=45464 RepID=A0A2G9V5R0_TELCI|nr:hypothetical protein TELCIR_00040 [Teladorsagia circumcincta]
MSLYKELSTNKHRQRLERLSSVGNEQIKIIIETNRHITARELGERLGVPKSTIHDHLTELGFVERLDVWVPHKLSERNLMDHVSVCDSLLKRNECEPFFKRNVTGVEKWVVYNNVERKRSWSHPVSSLNCWSFGVREIQVDIGLWDMKSPKAHTVNVDSQAAPVASAYHRFQASSEEQLVAKTGLDVSMSLPQSKEKVKI